MAETIFYSWQSDSPNPTNRGFIERALEKALADLKSESIEGSVIEACRNPTIDKDTEGVAGSPPIMDVILKKIDDSFAFVADLTYVGQGFDEDSRKRLIPNPNVLIEYGYAVKSKGHGKIIAVMNTAFGGVEDESLPFDIRHLRRPITYCLHGSESSDEKKEIRRILVNDLKGALSLLYESDSGQGIFLSFSNDEIVQSLEAEGMTLPISQLPSNQAKAKIDELLEADSEENWSPTRQIGECRKRDQGRGVPLHLDEYEGYFKYELEKARSSYQRDYRRKDTMWYREEAAYKFDIFLINAGDEYLEDCVVTIDLSEISKPQWLNPPVNCSNWKYWYLEIGDYKEGVELVSYPEVYKHNHSTIVFKEKLRCSGRSGNTIVIKAKITAKNLKNPIFQDLEIEFIPKKIG